MQMSEQNSDIHSDIDRDEPNQISDNDVEEALKGEDIGRRKRILSSTFFSVVVVVAALFFSGNPIAYRLFSFILDIQTIFIAIVLLIYYLWYTHRIHRIFGKKEPTSDQKNDLSKIRKYNVSIIEGLKKIVIFLWQLTMDAIKLIISPANKYIHAFPHDKKLRKRTYIALLSLLIIFIGLEVWKITRPVYLTPRDLEDSYKIVRDSVPADGPIIIKLPAGVDKSGARRLVRFEPDIKVGYARTLSDKHIAFRLKEELLIGDRYRIYFDDEEGGEESVVFKAVVRPKVEIFQPNVEIVRDEYSSITIFFNRAMIPLESLDRTFEPESFPISISPETRGEFKWVSSRQLQFIPETHLIRSSNYTVSIGDEFYSSDGLQVLPRDYNFKVKPHSRLLAHDLLRKSYILLC